MVSYTPKHVEEILEALGKPITEKRRREAYTIVTEKGGFYEITGKELPNEIR